MHALVNFFSDRHGSPGSSNRFTLLFLYFFVLCVLAVITKHIAQWDWCLFSFTIQTTQHQTNLMSSLARQKPCSRNRLNCFF